MLLKTFKWCLVLVLTFVRNCYAVSLLRPFARARASVNRHHHRHLLRVLDSVSLWLWNEKARIQWMRIFLQQPGFVEFVSQTNGQLLFQSVKVLGKYLSDIHQGSCKLFKSFASAVFSSFVTFFGKLCQMFHSLCNFPHVGLPAYHSTKTPLAALYFKKLFWDLNFWTF